jgi:crotonobetainyl-CoA:carnitine CoA-transferase CaiB-like acyl-CoA transferase
VDGQKIGDSARPLAGVGLVEFGDDIGVRYFGRLFAQMGADVWRPAIADDDLTPEFSTWLDQGKHAATSQSGALAALETAELEHRLVLAGQAPEEIAKARAALAGDDPAPMLVALTWFDPRGCYGQWRGNDPLIQAMTGVAFGFGETQGPPMLAQGHAPQMLGAVAAFIAALAGLMAERRPSVVEANIFETAMCFLDTTAAGAAVMGIEARRLGVNRFSPTWPCRVYRAADGYVGVTALTPSQWQSMARLMGRPELADEPRFRTSLQRLAEGDEIDAIVAEALARRSVDYWVENGIALRIPLTPAPAPGELPTLPHWQGRGAFAPVLGDAQGPTSPFRFTYDGARKARPCGGPAGPLEGVRVADFSMGWAGPLAARYLADLGADVLKIESHARRDWWRGWEIVPDADPPPYELPRNFMAVNRNKRGLDLDLSKPEDHAAAEAIVRAADLVLENQGPGVMDKLGLGPADQRRLNPSVICVSMPPFGASGPLAGLRAYGSTVEQACGMPFVNGRAEWDPCMQHVAYGDPIAGLYAAAGALVGLYARERLGAATIEVCQVECLFQLTADAILAETATGAPSPRPGSRRAAMAPCCVVAGAGHEAWLAVAVDSDEAWRAFARAIERPDLADDADLTTLAGRKAREDELEAAVAAWAAVRDPRDAAEALQAAGVAASAVTPGHELFLDLHLQDCEFWAPQRRRYIGDHFTPQAPFRHDGQRPPVVRPAPTLGEHTEEVLEELGIARKVL